ncbi:MAG: SAM-dependent methyltransferase, partial [Deltaproteobacteria bacterium]|nr:SAM-dependent methyltransferase [Deltaproteobacteria bacterium]
MTLSVPRVRHYLKSGELEKLFIEELGWDRHSASLDVPVDGQTYPLRAFAEKRGVQIFVCQPDGDGKIPEYNTRRKIEKQVTKSAYEHLIIFVNSDLKTQIWQWVAQQPGQPAAYREHPYYRQHQSGDALIQKLDAITIPLDEEEALDLTGTIHKLRDAFDRDRVTKRFYDHFQREHTAFRKFISGITEQGDKEWYASLMLNRLMFIYFIQQKSFLNGDQHYLRNRLQIVQERKGKGKFHTFYRYFLRALFHEGFAKQPEDRKLDADLVGLLSEVPYFNGGLFEVHQLEELYPKIDIPDEAFEHLFTFFDEWDWTLDTRPLRNDKEINPDVLGYIFEKYINQKEMGAYYTKEDITEYISKNTVVPHLFDAADKKCAVAFQLNSALWRLLQDDPDRYIYPAVHQGVTDEHGEVIPESTLPEFVQNGMHDPKARMFNKGYNLGQASIPDGQGNNLALPTETWREYVARRQRCLELREKLRVG